tara:strand:+ start:122 stop:523 length:402 start_codon:yes stop_codon:yes gene_type:complete
MNDKVDQKLNDIMGIESTIKKETAEVIKKVPARTDNVETDYRYARENLYNLVERGQDAIDGILELSRETEHPRAYEVAGQLIKTVADTAEKLIDLQKKVKDVESEEQKRIGTQHNHLYVGSTSELQKFLKKNK